MGIREPENEKMKNTLSVYYANLVFVQETINVVSHNTSIVLDLGGKQYLLDQ